MTVLTRISPDLSDPSALRHLSNTRALHAAIARAFEHGPGRPGRTVWRIDTATIYVQSDARTEGFDAFRAHIESKDIDNHLAGVRAGETVSLRAVIAAANSEASPKRGVRGEKFCVRTPEQMEAWLGARDFGFDLGEHDLRPMPEATFAHGKGNGKVTFVPFRLDARATVTDPERFVAAVRNGIGRERAYGCGLVTFLR